MSLLASGRFYYGAYVLRGAAVQRLQDQVAEEYVHILHHLDLEPETLPNH